MASSPSPEKMYFNEIVGLRAYLALWVAVGHGLETSGFLAKSNPLTAFFLNAHSAVVIFMIISGFVISHLLLTKHERYPRYITRRFFRLFPAFAASCLFGYLVTGLWAEMTKLSPWQSSPGFAAYASSIYELQYETVHHFWTHAALHLTMLHGLVPDEFVNRAAMVFLPAAWSLSLEWQFYLVAPVFVLATRRTWLAIGALIACSLAFLAYQAGYLGHYDIKSSLASATPAFFVGIVCRLAYPKLREIEGISPILGSAIVIFVGATMLDPEIPYLLWGVFYCFMLWRRHVPKLASFYNGLFTTAPIMLVGEASYSLYLFHRPIQVLLGHFAVTHYELTRPSMFAVQLLAVAVTIPVSILSYFTIERGGMKLGRWAAGRIPGRGPAAKPEEPAVQMG